MVDLLVKAIHLHNHYSDIYNSVIHLESCVRPADEPEGNVLLFTC